MLKITDVKSVSTPTESNMNIFLEIFSTGFNASLTAYHRMLLLEQRAGNPTNYLIDDIYDTLILQIQVIYYLNDYTHYLYFEQRINDYMTSLKKEFNYND